VISDTSNLAQWTELGAELSGPNGESRRREIINNLEDLEIRAENALRSAYGEASEKIQALLQALDVAKQIAHTVQKPVDLSAL
jgi:hypothetical protein